jgi:hypothetical protein
LNIKTINWLLYEEGLLSELVTKANCSREEEHHGFEKMGWGVTSLPHFSSSQVLELED